MTALYFIDVLGTMVFAISGALTAMDKRLDFFGISAVGFVTAIGGGTVRDLLIGHTPVSWMADLAYLMMTGVGITVALLFRGTIQKLRRTLFLFDTIGIAVFTILGLQRALTAGIDPVISVMMGMVSAVFGGVIRDIICNEIPLIFRKEIYAIVCIAGGLLYISLQMVGVDQLVNIVVTSLFIILLRILAVVFHWKLPEIS